MARLLTVARSLLLRQTLALLLIVALLFPATALATTYGSGAYGACEFEDGCASTAGGGSTTTTSTNSTSTDDDTDSEGSDSTIILNSFEDFFSSKGKDVSNLEADDVVALCIGKSSIFDVCDSTKESFHTATLKSLNLGAGTVVITIASTPTDYTLALDTPMKIDIDKDETDDIEATLTEMAATTADINFRSLDTSTPTTTETTDTAEDTPKATESSSLSWVWWLLIGIGLLALLLFVLVAFFKKKRDDDDNGTGSNYGSGQMGNSNSGGSPSNTTSSNITPSTFATENYIPTNHSPGSQANLSWVGKDTTTPTS